jgi:hypothetical protein
MPAFRSAPTAASPLALGLTDQLESKRTIRVF